MIKTNEIRVGNYFEHNGNWCYREARDKGSFTFQWNESDWYALGESTLFLEDVSPIPLTPEILEKCGFKNTSIGTSRTIENGFWYLPFLPIRIGYITKDTVFQYEINSVLKEVEFLHTLQNVVYFLTSTELTINL